MTPSELDPRYIERLSELPFVRGARFAHSELAADSLVELLTPRGQVAFRLQAYSGLLTRQAVGPLLARWSGANSGAPLLVSAPHVPRAIARLLAEADINFVDLAGNCRIRVGEDYLAAIEGRAAVERPRREVRLRGPGYQVVFGLLVEPGLASQPVRAIADEVGVGKTVVADTLRALELRGLIVGGRKRLVERRGLARLWLGGYGGIVRPSLLIGRYRVAERAPGELEARMTPILDANGAWAWGGAAAAERVLPHYRGEETVVHLLQPTADLARRLRAVPDDDGHLVLMHAPGPLALRAAAPRTVHPLLIYAELMEGDERAREAALLLAERHLKDFV